MTKWIPEAPEYPGTYAIEPHPNGATCTRDHDEALQFDTRAECQAWCDGHPAPPFVPKEHEWVDPRGTSQT